MIRKWHFFAFIFFSFILFFRFLSKPQASCICQDCPSTSGESTEASLSFKWDYVPANLIFIGSTPGTVGQIPQHHNEVQSISNKISARLTLPYSDSTSLLLSVPYIFRSHEHIHRHHGIDIPESWYISELGDISIGLIHRIEQATFLLEGKLPTGATNRQNTKEKAGEIGIQPGSGSFDFILGLAYEGSISAFSKTLPIMQTISIGIPGYGLGGYTLGSSLTYAISTTQNWGGSLSTEIGLTSKYQEQSNFGTLNEEKKNTGGRWIWGNIGINWKLNNASQSAINLYLPLYQHLNGIQITSGWMMQVESKYMF